MRLHRFIEDLDFSTLFWSIRYNLNLIGWFNSFFNSKNAHTHTHSPQININTKQTKTLRNDKTISKTTQKLTQKNKTEPKIEFIECFETDSVNVVALVFLLPIE